jgi:multiple sugar transport system permease protein
MVRLLRSGLRHLVLVVGSLAMAAPFLWMLKVSVAPESDIFVFPPTLIPRALVLQNWGDAWTAVPFGRYFLNSALMAATITLGNVVVCAMAAYACARMRVPGRDAIFLTILASIMIPHQVLLIPQFEIMTWFGWVNTYQGLIVPGIGTAFGVFLLRQFFLQIPRDLEDAARIDGCGWLGVLWRIVLPLAVPGLVALALLTAMGAWNAFLWPLVVTTKQDMFTVQMGLRLFFTEYSQRWGPTMAATCFVTLPVLAMFVLGQRQFVRGIVMTGLK